MPPCLLCFRVLSVVQKTKGVKFWGMSKDHPIRKELERDPGVLLGTVHDLDLSKFRRGNNEKTSGMPEIFRRNLRSEEDAQCHIRIQETKTYPGHCIRTMNGISACQNDEYIEINHNECS
ncbi:uncharacterized protein LOC118186800 [Stegodyphus dumicola]|uniref:uncharacterized protein LOC118186800 n=1 Tax=Stegodyphus dumicola TaxID=202533 RepID=UPI0015A94D65|nr:uncharacterized protein LOC118186800 [Stegodyphus dumicola]